MDGVNFALCVCVLFLCRSLSFCFSHNFGLLVVIGIYGLSQYYLLLSTIIVGGNLLIQCRLHAHNFFPSSSFVSILICMPYNYSINHSIFRSLLVTMRICRKFVRMDVVLKFELRLLIWLYSQSHTYEELNNNGFHFDVNKMNQKYSDVIRKFCFAISDIWLHNCGGLTPSPPSFSKLCR